MVSNGILCYKGGSILIKHSGKCFYCQRCYTSRCVDSVLFGSSKLDGAQAEFVRVPMADSTAFKAPETISNQSLVLMADIFPTGFFGVESALQLCPGIQAEDSTIVIVGCGPVGLCAIASALYFRFKHIFAIDMVPSRLEMAEKMGAEPFNFETNNKEMSQRLMEATGGLGADMVVEAVGLASALDVAYNAVRPFGAICSIGVHNGKVSRKAQL